MIAGTIIHTKNLHHHCKLVNILKKELEQSQKINKLISISDSGEVLDTSSSALNAKIKQIFVNDPLEEKHLPGMRLKTI